MSTRHKGQRVQDYAAMEKNRNASSPPNKRFKIGEHDHRGRHISSKSKGSGLGFADSDEERDTKDVRPFGQEESQESGEEGEHEQVESNQSQGDQQNEEEGESEINEDDQQHDHSNVTETRNNEFENEESDADHQDDTGNRGTQQRYDYDNPEDRRLERRKKLHKTVPKPDREHFHEGAGSVRRPDRPPV
jgi:hypothetical protein